MWQKGELSVGMEHFCTNCTQVIMAMLYPQLFKGSYCEKRLLAACVHGELHELGLRMLSDFFEMDGWDTDYLGANTPLESIVRAIEEKPVDVLAISATMYYHLENAQKIISAVRQASDAKILLGGYSFRIDDSLWKTLGADGTANNALDAIKLAKQLTGKGIAHD